MLDTPHVSPGSTVGVHMEEQHGVEVQGPDKTQHDLHIVPALSPTTNLPRLHFGAAKRHFHLPELGLSNYCSSLPPTRLRLRQLRHFARKNFQPLLCYQSGRCSVIADVTNFSGTSSSHPRLSKAGFTQYLEGSTFVS